jgi:hypothetical protein
MGLRGDEAQEEAWFGPFGDSATLDARLLHGLLRTYRRLGNSIRGTQRNSLVMWVMWNLLSICFEIVLASVQDRCSVFVKRTIGSLMVLDAPDGTPRRRGSGGALFGPFGDIANLDAR